MFGASAAVVVFAAMSLYACVEPGENIIANGNLDCDGSPLPVGWMLTDKDANEYKGKPWGCLGGQPSFGFYNHTATPKSFVLRQWDFTLVSGAKYRISAKVRTRNFRCSHYGIGVANFGWTKEVGLASFKPDQDWTDHTVEVAMVDARRRGSYMFVFYASKYGTTANCRKRVPHGTRFLQS